MITTKRILIIILFLTGYFGLQAQEQPQSLQEDNPHLQAGITCFEAKRFIRAAFHFQQSFELNENDLVAGEYLYRCYIELNKSTEAYEVYQKLLPESREKLKKSLPKLRFVYFEEGLISCNQMEKFDSLDIDGEDNIYGETDITQDGNYFNGVLSWGFKNGYSVNGGYTLVTLNKNKVAKIGDTLSVDDLYPLKQHQVYLNGNIPLGKGYSVLPAFNLVLESYKTVMPQLSQDSINYVFPVEEFRLNSYIGFLSVTKDFNIVQATLFAAISNLNEKQQFQAGFQAIVFPLGNLNFYLSSKLLNHNNDGVNHFIFEQMAGFRLTRSVSAEVNATFGRMQNYHEKNAFIVYNIADQMRFKGGAKVMFTLAPRWVITGEYLYLLREGEFVYYSKGEDQKIYPVTETRDFSNNIFLIGLKWKF
jgi:hypothetical protein